MSRYPGTQFVLQDNSNVAAIVPVQDVNTAAPVYMTTFRAPKGSEDMLTVFGNRFYSMYGTQDKMNFNTYKQPLLQASMDVNGGAILIAKRAVLETAKLSNATVGLVLSKEYDVDIKYDDDAKKYKPEVPVGSSVKYVLRPAVVSIKDPCNITADELQETKYIYSEHKKEIFNAIETCQEFILNTGASAKQSTNNGVKYIDLDNGTTVEGHVVHRVKNGFTSVVNSNTFISNAPVFTGIQADDIDITFKRAIYTAIKGNDATKETEYFFPLFTIFDNGRGESLKNISIVFDTNTSKTTGKAVYTLKISDSKTGKNLESYAFAINPYAINNNTGYTFDIESAVNLASNQISVKYHYDVYDRLVTILSDLVGSNEYVFETSDVLFGHNLNGQYLSSSDGREGGLVQKGKGAIDLYAFSSAANNNIDFYGDEGSSDDALEAAEGIYYFYNYRTRYKNNLTQTLLFGDDGVVDETCPIKSEKTDTYLSSVASSTIAAPLYNTSGAVVDGSSSPTESVPINLMMYDSANNKHVNTLKVVKSMFPSINLTGIITGTDEDSTATKLRVDDFNGGYIDIKAYCTGIVLKHGDETVERISEADTIIYTVKVNVEAYTVEASYQNQYRKFFNGQFDLDIFNLDVWFPNCVFDANYDKPVKLAIQKLAAYRGDFFAYLDLNTDVKTFGDVKELIDVVVADDDNEFPVDENEATNYYIHDRSIGVTSIYGDIRDPYSNKQITVTATYGLSLKMINHFINGVGRPFCGQGNNIVFDEFIEGTINYVPKIYPSSAMTSRSFIGDTYPSDDETIRNEKQLMCDLHVNYGSFYNGVLVMDTEYTLNPTESEFSYINNIMLVHRLMQAIRRRCPASRYKFTDSEDLSTYQKAVEDVIKLYRSSFAKVTFKYIQDENSVANKIYYAAIEVVFRPFDQAEIFTITALNYSTLSDNVTTV